MQCYGRLRFPMGTCDFWTPSTKSGVTDRFVNRESVLAVCMRFIRECVRFAVIRDFRWLNHGEN
jgi:hypothetical protein